ncbi:DUF4198 domain-containing protein [Chitinophaga rhizophila]|uniref:DUF4198 domain-containing protein n=1 Tax=Chitinophaga rhizophila TaxID=2866212 RepID=A0ABS7G657_9BACT|nr:DUF4198 domain-containing protein [Chitinophaga rhizophila]MBW8682876.1 DUF4198 domain-containing protein [Chitinophaga rhizophila]
MKKITLSVALLLCAFFASAHAVWIETALKGTKNKAQEVKVYLGEYAENQTDSVAHWFSNLKDIKLYAVTPTGSREEVTLKDNGTCLSGSFTPATEGTYTLAISHTVETVYGETKIEYYATATVVVGKESTSQLSSGTAFSIVPGAEEPKNLATVPLTLFRNKQPLAEGKIEVISPDGWIKELKSNQRGEASFSPVQPGQYLLEASATEKVSGTHKDQPFKSVAHIVTHAVNVKK